MKKALCAVWLLLLCLVCTQAMALAVSIPAAGTTVEVCTTELEGEEWLFLPSFADLSSLYPNAVETEEAGVWLDAQTGLRIMQSQNLRTLFLFSADPVNEGRAWVESDPEHHNSATGMMAFVRQDGHVDYIDSIRELRGRGNYTWGQEKKGYQLKTENTADLLKTGNQENLSRTWILLSETFDGTLLRNRIALDMALEMGAEASETEFVDLYYDGEYRGVYLLAEKVEIGEGRVRELDYDALLKKWNKKVGQPDLDVLPTAYGENAYGQSFSYVKDVLDNDHPASGAYLLEWENQNPAQDDRSWFAMEDGSFCVIKSPKNASESMMRYISETFLLACRKLQQDATVEEYFDLESMARAVLLNELSANCDGFHYSSTYFVLPAESKQFRAGPVWDFDLAFRYRLDKGNGSAIGFKDTQGWMIDFYRSTAFLETAKRVYLEQIDPLMSGILLGDGEGDHLKSYDAYVQQISAASRMNARRWSMAKDGRFLYGQTIEEETALLRKFLTERSAWLKQAMSDFRPDENHLPLWLIVRYGHPETGAQIISAPWQAAEVVSAAAEQLSEADEENFALWQLEAVLALPEGMEKPSLSLNGTPIAYEEQEDGSVLIRVAFEDPSYRPVDYYGEDIGLVYQYDSYVARYPEIAEMFGSDPEMVMEYFCEEGMYEGQIGNAYFDPRKVLELNSWLHETLGENWQDYYWDYIAYGYDEGWMQNTSERFVPQVADAL